MAIISTQDRNLEVIRDRETRQHKAMATNNENYATLTNVVLRMIYEIVANRPQQEDLLHQMSSIERCLQGTTSQYHDEQDGCLLSRMIN